MTEIIKPGSSLENFSRIVKLLTGGKIIGLPTETVYGLAGDATNEQTVATIFALKNRPGFNPLICHFAHLQDIHTHCFVPPILEDLARAFWPGPLTVILKLKPSSNISSLTFAGLDTLAVRIPDHPIALEIIERFGRPLAAPSANPSESISPTLPEHILKAFGGNPSLALIVDGGPCKIGLESTVLDLAHDKPVILRPGEISKESLEKIMGDIEDFAVTQNKNIRAPGMLKRHYAPTIPLRMNAVSVQPGEALLAFGENVIESHGTVLNLSPSGNLMEAASNLFTMLHQLDHPQYTGIAVMTIPQQGIGVAINDRLKRAATSL